MIASPPFVRALRQPVPAALGRGAKAPVLAVTPLPAVTGGPIRAGRDLPGSALAPKVTALPRPQTGAAQSARSVARGAALLSTVMHLGLVAGWAVLASPARPLLVPDLDSAQVDLISEAQFSALTAPQPELAATPASLMVPPAPPLSDLAMPPEAAPRPAMPAPEIVAPAQPDSIAPDSIAPDIIAAAEPPPVVDPAPVAEEPPPAPKPAPVADLPKPKAAKPKATSSAPKVAPPAPAEPKPRKAAKSKASDKAAVGGETASAAPGKAASKGEAKAQKADWGAKVRSRITRKLSVPKGTPPGRAKLRVTIAPTGALLAVDLVESSGLPALDRAALKAAKSAAPFPRAPKGLTEASYSFTIPIRQDG